MAGAAFPPLQREGDASTTLQGGFNAVLEEPTGASAHVAASASATATPLTRTAVQKQFQLLRSLIAEHSHDAALNALDKLESMIQASQFEMRNPKTTLIGLIV